MSAALYRDDPRRRLPWLLLAGLVLSTVSVASFLRLLIETPVPLAPRPIEVDMIEPAPPPPDAIPQPLVEAAPPIAVPQPSPQALKPEPPLRAEPPPSPALAPQPAPPGVPTRPQVTQPQGPPVLERLRPGAPLTPEQRDALNKIYSPGNDGGHFAEGVSGEESARSKKAPPLTAAQWKALDDIHRVGNSASEEEAGHAAARSALSKKAPPLTTAQWNALDRIYRVGRNNYADQTAAEVASNATANTLSAPTGKLVASRIVPPPQPGVIVSRGHGALPSNQPLPEVPDRLLDSVAHWTAVARFKVAVDGSAEVELTKPFPDGGFTDALLECLRQWRFFPAAELGRPVASIFEVQIAAE